jgi:hypothetical protein
MRERSRQVNRGRCIVAPIHWILAVFATVAMVTVPVQVVRAQSRADSLAVTRAVLGMVSDTGAIYAKKIADLFKASGDADFIESKGEYEVGVERRVIDRRRISPTPIFLPALRSADSHAALLEGTKAASAGPVESLPRSCWQASLRGSPREYCRIRDFDIIVSLSLPEFDHTKASVVVHTYANPGFAGSFLAQATGMYELERINNQWKVVARRPLFTS